MNNVEIYSTQNPRPSVEMEIEIVIDFLKVVLL